MKTIIQIVIAVLVVIACAQAGQSAWRYYSFKDALAQEAVHTRAKTTSQLHQRVLEIAGEYGIVLDYDDVQVGRQGELTTIDVVYQEDIKLVPVIYTMKWTYQPSVSEISVKPITVDKVR